jgi:HAE1 family hydrophobic/amphiphilic exporter-1
MFLPEIAIRKPVTTVMIMLAILVFGVIGFLRLGVDQFPKVDYPVVTVTTLLDGASPEVIEENITDIIEEEVATIEGVKNLTSVSSHSASVVTIEFEMDRDIDIAAQDVRDRINRLLRALPDGTEMPSVDKLDMSGQPIMWIAVSGERSISDITAYAEDVLKPRFESIKGVGSILMGGKRERTIRIWLDRDKLEARGVTALEVAEALRIENVEIPGGYLQSQDMEFSIKTEGELSTVNEFNDLIVAFKSGYPVRLRDVGEAVDGLDDPRSLARYSGDTSVGLGVRKKAGANTVQIARLIKKDITALQDELPPGIKLDYAFDASVFIEASIKEMEFALIFGGMLAVIVVFFFLRNLTATIIAGITIPLSIIGTMLCIYFMGFTLNTMTMLALTLAIGIVIDDAIIIVENIHRKRAEGMGLIEAAKSGSSEIAFAAVATTFALGAIFIPVAFMKGVIGNFFFEFGITVAIAVFLSTFIALTLTPMLSSKFLRLNKERQKTGAGFFSRIESFYSRLLERAIMHKVIVLLLALGFFVSSIFVWRLLGKEFLPSEDQSRFMVIFSTPVGSSMDYTDRKLQSNESVLLNTPEIRSFFAAIGLGETGGVNKGLMFVRMHPKGERERSQQEVVGELRGKLAEEPGIQNFVSSMSYGFGARRGPPLEFIIKGPTMEGLDKYSQEIVERAKKIDGLVGLDTDFDAGLPELKVHIDRNRAADLGLDTTKIARAIKTLVGGSDVTTFKDAGKRYDVRVKLRQEHRTRPEDLERLVVRNSRGEQIRLGSVIEVTEGVAPSVITRRDRARSVTVYSNLAEGKPLGEAIEDMKKIALEVLPEGYTVSLGGQAEQFGETFLSMLFAFALAVLITYMVLASLFESFVHPFTVMLALPLSIVGALGALFLTGSTVNIYSLIGVTLLIGLVTKNSIILVDYINRLRAAGLSIKEAVLRAGPVRLRPILMTAFSTILGVLPTALAIGPGSESRAPMAIATIGGLVTATFLTLVVIPVAYVVIDDFITKVRERFLGKAGA